MSENWKWECISRLDGILKRKHLKNSRKGNRDGNQNIVLEQS